MRQLGKIKCLEQINDSTAGDEAPWVIFFHGYGADANDLFPLAQAIPTRKTLNWLFPQGTLEVPIGPGWTGRAWWNIDMNAIQAAAQKGETRDMSDETPAGLKKSREMAFEMIKQMRIPWNKIILGGFSQGGMLATDLYLHAPETPAGLVLMSSTLLNQEEWKGLVPARAGQKFFQSHGERDTVLGIKQARQLETLLCQNGMKGSLMSFGGGHEIPGPVLGKIGIYLDQQI